jgi:Zn-dependent metalloprotease
MGIDRTETVENLALPRTPRGKQITAHPVTVGRWKAKSRRENGFNRLSRGEYMRIARKRPKTKIIAGVAATMWFTVSALAADAPIKRTQLPSVRNQSGEVVQVIHNPVTGTPRLVRIPTNTMHLQGESNKMRALHFFELYKEEFGIRDPGRELEEVTSREDIIGMTHLRFRQLYQGVPVFAADMRAHFSQTGELVTVNGTFVPNVALDPAPSIHQVDAADFARTIVAKEKGLNPVELQTSTPTLYVFRAGLARGVPGEDHLVWEIEVTHGSTVREILYVDAHRGMIVDRIQGIEQITRIVHHQTFDNQIWAEGDSLPFAGLGATEDAEVNGLIDFAQQTYDLYSNITGGTYLSFNGFEIPMQNVYDDQGLECPNAQWNGRYTRYCVGMATDDVVAHEWTHAYSRYTHGLIYQWQPGALNESYSDIFGEIVDLANGVGFDDPSGLRTAEQCSTFGGLPAATLTVNSPAAIAGGFEEGGAGFNPPPPWNTTAEVEMVNDGVDPTDDGCSPLVDFTPGRIALIYRGTCSFYEKVGYAEDAGAVGAIIINNRDDRVLRMGSDAGSRGIPAVFLGQSDGASIEAALVGGVEASLVQDAAPYRDMWNPNCRFDPGRVSSGQYVCDDNFEDNGGVHSNSGVSNHAFALLVDGGTYNGHTIAPIGVTKAAHVYWRAMSVYQVPTTIFAEHADLLELSCTDLIGASLRDLFTGEISSEVIGASDCDQLSEAMLAVEMRADPWRCNFQPLLAPNPPQFRASRLIYSESFDTDPGPAWILSNEGVYDEYNPRDWRWTTNLPADKDGGAFFAIDSPFIGNCIPGDNDQSGVMHLESPQIDLPTDLGQPFLLIDHYVATEPDWDGGNIKISVNGGAYRLVDAEAFRFNAYNASIVVSTPDVSNNNPLAGQPGFSGVDGGELDGSWGQSQIDLSLFAGPGDSIQLRFDFGVDGCSGNDGWYIEKLEIVSPGGSVRRGSRRLAP